MTELIPVHNKGFSWFSNGNCHAKGYVYHKGQCLMGMELVHYFSKLFNKEENFVELAKKINGCFVFIISNEDYHLAISDKFRSFPLFWSLNNNKFIISDDASVIYDKCAEMELDPVSEEEFIKLYCVSGHHTLYKNIFKIPAGNILEVKNNKHQLHIYWDHNHNYESNFSSNSLMKELDKVCNSMFERLITSLDGKTAVIPLSGGLDSRLIAVMLKKLGYKNVICYTYGRRKGFEAVLAEKIAKKLEFPWYFIEYTSGIFQHYFTEEAESYRKYGFNYSSLPHEQDYFALTDLKSKGLIPDNSIFIPGFCGDLLAGSYLPDYYTTNKLQPNQTSLLNLILNSLYEPDNTQSFALLERLKQQLKAPENIEQLINLYEAWFTTNKVSNYIINSVKVYEYFGYEWRMPLWDDEWMQIWYSLPNEFRYDKNFYKKWLNKSLLEPFDITGEPQGIDNYKTHKGLLTYLKHNTSASLRKLLKPLFISKKVQDINNFEELKKIIYKKIKDSKQIDINKNVNHINALWEIQKLKE